MQRAASVHDRASVALRHSCELCATKVVWGKSLDLARSNIERRLQLALALPLQKGRGKRDSECTWRKTRTQPDPPRTDREGAAVAGLPPEPTVLP